MSLEFVRQILVERLKQGDRGDRGWFIVTRVHVSLSWLKSIAEYLENRGGSGPIRLTKPDYYRLAAIIETDSADPGVQLRRHHLLVMDKPLQLLQRVSGQKWNEIVLTERGRELANDADPAGVLEQSLSAIRFAVHPWSPPSRANQYAAFDVAVYRAMKDVLRQCNGYIDRNEFDFFVSRIRKKSEAAWVVDAIAAYRNLASEEQDSLHTEVRSRIPGEKSYQNWRDIGLHTFSLFSLGTSMVREGSRLLLTSKWVAARSALEAKAKEVAEPQLRMPDPPEIQELLAPPAAPASNVGADAESFVAKVLRSQGWEVAFYTNRRGYGFDLWARKGGQAMVIEVKSSLSTLHDVILTSVEYQAAREHGESFILALVENMESESPRLRMIQNPFKHTVIRERTSTSYLITRAEWLRVAGGNA